MAGPSAFETLIFRVELHIEEWLVEGSAIIFYSADVGHPLRSILCAERETYGIGLVAERLPELQRRERDAAPCKTFFSHLLFDHC